MYKIILATLLTSHASILLATQILFLGDSLTEGYGIDQSKAYPSLIQKALEQQGMKIKIANASVSGSTSASAMGRFKWVSKNQSIDVLVLALGANDGLRGLPNEMTLKNLDQVIEVALQQQIKVVIAGMQVPNNLGADYAKKFANIYPQLQSKHSIILMPFLLEGVAGNAQLNLADGIHPNEAGHQIIAETLLPYIQEALQ